MGKALQPPSSNQCSSARAITSMVPFFGFVKRAACFLHATAAQTLKGTPSLRGWSLTATQLLDINPLRLRSESSTACITTSYTSTVCSVQVIEIDSWGCVLDSGTTWITSALLSSHIIAFRFIDCSALVGLSMSISIPTQVRPDFDLPQTHWSRASKPSSWL